MMNLFALALPFTGSTLGLMLSLCVVGIAPLVLMGILSAAGALGGAALSARGQSQANQQSLAQAQAARETQGGQDQLNAMLAALTAQRGLNQDTAQTYANELSNTQSQAAAGLAATAPGGNPFATNNRRIQNAVLRALTEGSAGGSWQAGGTIPGVETIGSVPQFQMNYGPYANQYLQPDVLANAESVFGQNLAQVSPNAAQPDLSLLYGNALGEPATSAIQRTQQSTLANQQRLQSAEREALSRGIADRIAGLDTQAQTNYSQSQEPLTTQQNGNSWIGPLLAALGGAGAAYGVNRYLGSQSPTFTPTPTSQPLTSSYQPNMTFMGWGQR
jgi:hypothetical protein